MRELAAGVITLLPDNTITVKRNSVSKLGIIVVIGPTVLADGRPVDEAVLCEVGLSNCKPYRRTKGLLTGRIKGKRRPRPRSLLVDRKKLASLSDAQYQFVAPIIFEEVQRWIDERVASWKSCVMYVTVTARRRFSRTRHSFVYQKPKRVPRFNPVPVTVDIRDTQLYRDIYWAEHANPLVWKMVDGLAKKLRLCRDHQRSQRRGRQTHTRGHPRELTTLATISEELHRTRLPQHLKCEVVRRFVGNEQTPFATALRTAMDWDGGPTQADDVLRDVLPNPLRRINGTRLQTLYTRRRAVTSAVLASLEIYARSMREQELLLAKIHQGEDDLVPF
jgi:hypothetical protein